MEKMMKTTMLLVATAIVRIVLVFLLLIILRLPHFPFSVRYEKYRGSGTTSYASNHHASP